MKTASEFSRPNLIPGTTDYAHTPGTNRMESSSGRGARSYTYDNAGNIVSDGIRDFVYDQRNRLARVEIGGATIAEYAYDAFHRRVKKVVDGETTYFHYGADGLLICETDGNGNAVRDYVYLNGEPVAMRVAGDWFWFLNDHLGTPRIMVDASGAVVWKAAYLPFGRAIVGLADVENNLRFPGQYFDAETGLHYNWHRYYDPGTGRYLRADPIGLAGGVNLYAYAQNNPISLIDPEGLWVAQTIGGSIGAAYGIYAAHQNGTSMLQGFVVGGLTGVLSTIPIPGLNGMVSGALMGSLSGGLGNVAGQATDPCSKKLNWSSLGTSMLSGAAGGALGGGLAGARLSQVGSGPLLNSVRKNPIFTPFGQDVISATAGGMTAGGLDAATH